MGDSDVRIRCAMCGDGLRPRPDDDTVITASLQRPSEGEEEEDSAPGDGRRGKGCVIRPRLRVF